MKDEDYKPLGFLGAIVLLAAGLILLGQAGVNTIEASNPMPVEETGQLLSASATALIEFLFGLIITIVGIFLFLVLQKKRQVFED